jgi:low affinity Fe/Cu permease
VVDTATKAGAVRQSVALAYGPPMSNPQPSSLRDRFDRISDWLTNALGSFTALAGSVLIVVVWALTGPIFNFSDTWQLFINTTTTVITFWMVFVIQNSANRSAKAAQLKLDEIIRALENARNDFIALDKATESTLQVREQEFDELTGDGPDPAFGQGRRPA